MGAEGFIKCGFVRIAHRFADLVDTVLGCPQQVLGSFDSGKGQLILKTHPVQGVDFPQGLPLGTVQQAR